MSLLCDCELFGYLRGEENQFFYTDTHTHTHTWTE